METPKLNSGEFAYDKLNNERVQVLTASDVWGLFHTKCSDHQIRDSRNSNYAAIKVEEDFKQQIDNTVRIKELISDSKDLNELIGTSSGFDLDASLRSMLVYYECSIGNDIPPIEHYNINDPVITRHLNYEMEFAPDNPAPKLVIKDFPNEKGYFMLWELSISKDEQSRRFIPIFINDDMILRPIAGKRIWDAILDEKSVLTVIGNEYISYERFDLLSESSRDFAYDTFISLKEDTEKRRNETYRKYMYALNLRIEAAERIGIDNIKKHKLEQLTGEKLTAEKEYQLSKTIFPEFRPVMIIRMEDGHVS